MADLPILYVIIASTRNGRLGPSVAAWFTERTARHGSFAVEVVDLATVNLPLLDEPNHPRLQQYEHEHSRAWSARIAWADAFVFVTPEYDFGPPASLVNALQYLLNEWAYKPIAFVSYGGVSAGTRSAQATKQIATALNMMPMFESVSIPFFAQHLNKETGMSASPKVQEDAIPVLLKELRRRTDALEPLRRGSA